MDSQLSKSEWIRAALREYEAPLLRYAVRLVGDSEKARDVVQETFLGLCQANRSQVRTHLAPWLFRVCRNRALDMRRKEKRVQPLKQTEEQAIASPDASPFAIAEQQEGAGQAMSLVGTLPEKQREVIYLRFGAGLTYKEISEVTGNSVSNVGVLIHEGVAKVRQQLGRREQAGAQVLATGRPR